MIEEQIAKRAAAADDEVSTGLTTASGPATPQKSAFDPSVIALISVALGSISAAFASVLVYLGKFESWQIPFVFGGIMLGVSVPSLILAFIKLRKRNLGPILDANNWAVNAKAKINVPFGTSLTGVAKLPLGAKVDIGDRYAEKSAAWPKFLLAAFLLWWVYAFLNDKDGRLYRWTDGAYGKVPVSVQEMIDQQNVKDKADKTGKAGTGTNAVPLTVSTNAPGK